MEHNEQTAKTLIEIVRQKINERRAACHADVLYFALNYENCSKLIDMRKRLWAIEFTQLNQVLEKLCEGDHP